MYFMVSISRVDSGALQIVPDMQIYVAYHP